MNQIAVADSAAEGGMRSDDSQVGILGIGGELFARSRAGLVDHLVPQPLT